MNTQELKNLVWEIRDSKLDEQEKYADFKKTFPKLFECACDPSFPLTFLDLMCEQINLLDTNKIDKDAAHQKIFDTLNSKYVDHLVPSKDA